jgi:hypothetical protein
LPPPPHFASFDTLSFSSILYFSADFADIGHYFRELFIIEAAELIYFQLSLNIDYITLSLLILTFHITPLIAAIIIAISHYCRHYYY